MCWIILSLSFFYFLLITNFLLTNVPHCSGINRKLSLHSITRYLWMRLEKFACCGECCGCFTGKISSFLPAFFPFASLNSVHVLRGWFFDCMGESQASVHVCVSVPRICVYENARSIFYFSGSALTQNVHKSLGAAAELYSCFHYTYTHETSQRRTIRRLYMYIWNMDECYCARVSIARRGAERDVCAVWIARPSTWRVCGRQTGRKLLYPEMQFLHTNTEEMCDSHKCSIVLRICMLVSVQSITRQHTSNRDAPVYTYDKASKRACCSLSYSGWGGWRAHTFTDVSLFISHTYGFLLWPTANVACVRLCRAGDIGGARWRFPPRLGLTIDTPRRAAAAQSPALGSVQFIDVAMETVCVYMESMEAPHVILFVYPKG